MHIIPDDRSDGESLRDDALTLLTAHRADLIRDRQRAALRLALTRDDITADDIRAVVPIPPNVRPVVVGAALRPLAVAGYLRRIGYRASARPVAHARPLGVWSLADAAGAAAWLAAHPAPAPAPAD